MAQRSMYELLNGANSAGNPDLALNAANSDAVVARQRFVFNGTGKNNAQSNAWTSRTVEGASGGSTVIGNDGLEMRTNALSDSGNLWGIDFDGKNQFDAASAVIIASVIVPVAASTGNGGLGDDPTLHSQPNWVSLDNNNESDYMTFQSTGAPASGNYYQFTSTGFPTTIKPYTYKIESGLSTQKCSINGTLLVTTTVNIVSGVNLEPFFKVYRNSSNSDTKKMIIRYCEAYNT